MKLYIFTDLEGVSGVVDFALYTRPGAKYYEQARRLLTGETNAAIAGAREAGADEITVLDGHGHGGINAEELHPGVELLIGRELFFPYRLDNTFDCVFLLGRHSMAGTEDGNLSHTYAPEQINNMWLNGQKIGEIGIEFALAGLFEVPVVLVTGDEAACREAKSYVENIETAAVKQGINRNSAVCLPPGKSRELIKEKAKKAVARRTEIEAYKIAPPYEVKIEYASALDAVKPGQEKVKARTIKVIGQDFIEVLRKSFS